MGTTPSVSIDKVVSLTMLPPDVWDKLKNERFTVQRNPNDPDQPKPGEPGAREETGWRIQADLHSKNCGDILGLGDALATNMVAGRNGQYIWRVFMNNGWEGDGSHPPSTPHVHACGWRACDPARRTFWPTRLTTPVEKEAWWKWFDMQLNSLPLLINSMQEYKNAVDMF